VEFYFVARLLPKREQALPAVNFSRSWFGGEGGEELFDVRGDRPLEGVVGREHQPVGRRDLQGVRAAAAWDSIAISATSGLPVSPSRFTQRR
jgi:hypothetical protein